MTPALALSDLRRGTLARVEEVDASHAARLAALGVRSGVVLSVEQDAPLGGPRIVRLGSARLALARSLTRGILVRTDFPDEGHRT